MLSREEDNDDGGKELVWERGGKTTNSGSDPEIFEGGEVGTNYQMVLIVRNGRGSQTAFQP